jgi:hypothetical protein
MMEWSLGKILKRGFLYVGLALVFLAAIAGLIFLSEWTGIKIAIRWSA